jgi:amino acid transporter
MYDYGGYNNVCFFAGEVKQPERVIPRAILLSIVAVAALYLTMNITIIGVVPWQEAIKSTAIVSDFIQRIHGQRAARGASLSENFSTRKERIAVVPGQ